MHQKELPLTHFFPLTLLTKRCNALKYVNVKNINITCNTSNVENFNNDNVGNFNKDNNEGRMDLLAKLDDIGRPAWIGLMVLGFIVFWPLGLGLLAYLIWSGRMGCSKSSYGLWGRCSSAGWRNNAMSGSGNGRGLRRSSGNRAFDEYRDETIKRLEDEQKEFSDYLERLRMAKDKSEFDRFMADRSRPTTAPDTSSGSGDPL